MAKLCPLVAVNTFTATFGDLPSITLKAGQLKTVLNLVKMSKNKPDDVHYYYWLLCLPR